MPERGFDTGYWTDTFIQRLPSEGKLLYIYLWTNSHCNQAGLYEIAPEIIAFETKLAEADIPALLEVLKPKAIWYPEHNLIWVKNFLHRQAKSPKFIVAAIKSLRDNRIPEEILAEFQLYNEQLLRGIAPVTSLTRRECVLIRDDFTCQYCDKEIEEATEYEIDHVIPVLRGGKDNYLNLVAACRICNQKKLDKTPSEAGLSEPQPTTFHAAQAIFILKNSPLIRQKWLNVFPQRLSAVAAILGNIETTSNNIETTSNNIKQYQSNIPSDLICSSASASADLDLISKAKEEVNSLVLSYKGKEDKNLANWFQLYMQNIGTLSPLITDRLSELSAIYPAKWFEEAVREAVKAEHRNLKYIEAILTRWKAEGFKAPKSSVKKDDPDKYIKGKYAHLVHR